jgi:glycosyltransferase involved in cell wall biosynthesis
MKVLLVQGALIPEQMAPWRAVSQTGIELHVACSTRGSSVNRDHPSADEFEIHDFKPVGLVSRGHLWWLYPGLRKLIRRLNPDVVHVTAEVYGLFYSQVDFDRRPIVGHVVDNIWTHGSVLERSIRLSRARRVLKKLSGVASWNRAGLELARRYGMKPGTPTAIVPARLVDPAPFRHARVRRSVLRTQQGIDDRVTVGFAGRLVPEKGVDWLLRSLSAAGEARNIRLQVYGEGRLESSLRALASQLDVDAQFLGQIPRTEMPKVLAGLDLVVVPSIEVPRWAEQFGRVIVEAMFAGTPVIASDSGSIPEVVGDAAVLVPEGDHAALSAAIDSLVRDAPMRIDMGERGAEWAETKYSPQVLARKYERLWREARAIFESA